jgi:hypothetical protein
MLECGARPTDRGWYTHAATWPACAATEGSGSLWSCVAADGRLRVFDGPIASSRTLLHSTPVLGPVLSLALWPERQVAVTLEEAEPSARCDRIIRFYSYASREREVLELAAIELDQPANSRVFSPSLFSLCTTTRTLALAHDTEIKLYDLDDIFCDESQQPSQQDADGDRSPIEEVEPGAEMKQATPQPSPSRAIAATFPHTRRYVVKVYQVLPVLTLYSAYSIRHLDYKQSYLSYSSYNECRLLCVRLEQVRAGHMGLVEREAIESERAYAESNLPTSQSLSVYSLSSTRATPPTQRGHRSTPSISQPAPPFELLGTRSIDQELRMVLRDDMYVREMVLVLHRRFGSSDQIHTMRLIPPLARRAVASRSGVQTPTSMPTHTRKSSSALPLPPSAATPIFSRPLSTKQELFALLGQGLPTQPFSVPLTMGSGSETGFVPSASFEHGGVTVELMDDEEEDGAGITQLQGLLNRLEELEDQGEAAPKAVIIPPQVDDAASSASSSSVPPASTVARSNGSIYLPMRLLVSSSEECHLYDVESDVKLVTYYFEHDLISLQVRSSFLLALTTHGLEVHSLWYAHPILHYLTLPLLIQREEPVVCHGVPLKERVQDMLVLDNHILFRPSPVQRSGHADALLGSPPTHLIVPTEEMDPCESWASWPVKALPSVLEVVANTVQPQAIKSMQSSKEATPSSIRLFTEALLLLIQRYSQLRVLVDRSANKDAMTRIQLNREFAGVSQALSSVNSYLAHLFLTAHELGLSCYFFYYQHDAQLQTLWNQLTVEVKHPNPSVAIAHTKYITKFLIKLLLQPTAAEQALLLSSPPLIASFIDHFGIHAPHVLGSILLKSFLLHCPYEPRQVLKILEENASRANYDAGVASQGQSLSQSYRTSKPQSSSGTPTSSAPSSGQVNTPYRVRPVVFHTFVQALMHLQLSATSGPSTTGSSGKDSASILLNSFSGHSLEFLLITHSSLLTTWAHRHLLVDFLRASVPWSLLEVLVVLTQRGEIHVHTGVTLLLGAHAAAGILAPTTTKPSPAASPASSPTASNLPLAQLQAYLECALNPFMLSQEIGSALEQSHGHSIDPFDSPADAEAYMISASDATERDLSDPDAKFVPMHIRENHKHHPGQVVLSQPDDGPSITRSQVAALATQLACFYIQHSLVPGSSSPPTRSAAPLGGAQRTRSMSSFTPSPAAEFSTRHALANWWRAAWIDQLRGSATEAAGGPQEEDVRVRRLHALLSSPLPLARQQVQQINALLKHLPNDAPSAPPVKTSLMMLILPRVGDLAAALRLVVAHSPECMWPFAQIYCGEKAAAGSTIPTSIAASQTILRHWQLLHAILLMHVFHSTHASTILHRHAPSLLHAHDSDEVAAHTLLQSLLPSHLVTSLQLPLDSCVSGDSANYAGAMSAMPPIERADLYHQLYVFLLEQLVQRHEPIEFLAFIPQLGSSRFYLEYVQQNFKAHKRPRRKQTNPGAIPAPLARPAPLHHM